MPAQDQSSRAGRYISRPTGYRAFYPAPLPPVPPIAIEGELLRLLSNADRALARLDAVSTFLPTTDLFVAMYVRLEAVLSSQIEGTQSRLEDVLAYEASATHNKAPKDVEEVVNYVRAMNDGLITAIRERGVAQVSTQASETRCAPPLHRMQMRSS